MSIDEIDVKLISELVKNGRMTVADLSKRIGAPRTTLTSRLRRLLESGIIRGFTALLNYKQLGYGITAFVLVQVKRGKPIDGRSNQEVFAEMIAKESEKREDLPWIEEAHIITGDYDILLKVRAKSMDELTNFLITELARHPDVERTLTLMVLKTPHAGLFPASKISSSAP